MRITTRLVRTGAGNWRNAQARLLRRRHEAVSDRPSASLLPTPATEATRSDRPTATDTLGE